ncbi:hypothetical protein EON63_09075 [archaeon]|nr:MAG: hypothetical protein EON63_09075 [archaeon]
MFLSSLVILLFVSWSAYILIHPHTRAQPDSHTILMKDIHKAQLLSVQAVKNTVNNIGKTQAADTLPTLPHTIAHTSIQAYHTPSQIAPTPSTLRRPILHTITYASHGGRDDRFCRAVESAVRASYNLTILNWNVPWEGLAQKLTVMARYTEDLGDDDVVLFSDAFDVLYTMPPDYILDIFLKREYKILFAGECGCWPHIVEEPKVCTEGYSQSPTPYR